MTEESHNRPDTAATDIVQPVDWLEQRLKRAARRHYVMEVAAFVTLAVAVLVLGFSVYALADIFLKFPRTVRLAITAGIAAGSVFLIRRHAGRRTFRFDSADAMARHIETLQERRGTSEHSIIISALEFGQRPAIPGAARLKNATIDRARTHAVDPATVTTYDQRHVKVALLTAAAAALVLAVWLAAGLPELKIFARRLLGSAAHYPTATRVVELTWARVAPSRQDYPIRVRVEGRLPANGSLSVKLEDRRPFTMPLLALTNGVYEAIVQGPEKSFSFSFVLGDYVSDRYAVDVRVPAFVQEGRLDVAPPAYTGLPRQTVPLGPVTVPEGSAVTLTVRLSRPVTSCDLAVGAARLPFRKSDGLNYTLALSGTNSIRYRIHVVGEDGLANPDDTEYDLAVLRDGVPRIKVLSPAPNSFVCDLSVLQFAMRLEDDYGLSAVSADYEIIRKSNGNEKVIKSGAVPIDLPGHGRDETIRMTKPARDFKAEPGDRIVFKMHALDNRTPTPGRGESDQIAIEMVSADELRKVLEGERARTGTLIMKLRDDEKKQAESIDRRLKGGTT